MPVDTSSHVNLRFEKSGCLKPMGICDIKYMTEIRILECVGNGNIATKTASKTASTRSAQLYSRDSDVHENKVIA